MIRPLLAAGLVLILAGLTTWLVRQEGQVYRQTLRADRREHLLARAIPPVAHPDGEAEPDPVARADVPPAESPPAPVASTPPPETVTSSPVSSIPEPVPPPLIVEKPIEVAPRVDIAGNAPMGFAPARRPPIVPIAAGKDPLKLTPEEEKAVGAALHALIKEAHRPIWAGPLQARIREAAGPLLKSLGPRDPNPYTFTILESDRVNAFSHVGNYVYVSRGLFDLVADDVELLFVLAHEIAHVEHKDGAERVSQAARKAGAAGLAGRDLVRDFYQQIALGHSEAQEYQADHWAFNVLRQLGHTPREVRAFPIRYLAYAERHGLGAGQARPRSAPADEIQDIENHWPSHPPAMLRFERLRDLPTGP